MLVRCTQQPSSLAFNSLYISTSSFSHLTRCSSTAPSVFQHIRCNHSGKGGAQEKSAPRNEVGVQLLSPSLRSQIFGNSSFPRPDPAVIQIAREHLASHSLDVSQGSNVPPVSFKLPALQGSTIDEHFHRIGTEVSEPHMSLVKEFASLANGLPPMPSVWVRRSGWTRYNPDGSQEPCKDPGSERMLCFDIETMPSYHSHAVMATAVSPTNWYSWVSPWLLEETTNPAHLIPLGDPSIPRVIVGHNVSYDRSRVKEEYSLRRTGNRWIDTMALHVAVKGISSNQRPAWMSHKKAKNKAKERSMESVEAVLELMKETEDQEQLEHDMDKREQLRRMKRDMEESLPLLLQSFEDDGSLETSGKRWEDIASANSLADVARLHCGIDMDKAPRDDFLTSTPNDISSNLETYLMYCATDVSTTYSVLGAVLPTFLTACPSPVSLAGVLVMGNGFFPVNETWEHYIKSAEAKYREVESTIGQRLVSLAQDAMKLMGSPEVWEKDEWLSQLDWSPKRPGRSRGFEPVSKQQVLNQHTPPDGRISDQSIPDSSTSLPKWYTKLVTSDCLSKRHMQGLIPSLLRMTWKSYPISHSPEHGFVYLAPPSSQPGLTHLRLSPEDRLVLRCQGTGFAFFPLSSSRKIQTLIGRFGSKALQEGILSCSDRNNSHLAALLCDGGITKDVRNQLHSLAHRILLSGPDATDPWISQLDWTLVSPPKRPSKELDCNRSSKAISAHDADSSIPTWPKWYWELTKPKKGRIPGTLDLTIRNQISPLLLRLRWQGLPLFRSREFGWTYRVPPTDREAFKTRHLPLTFANEADASLAVDSDNGYVFYKLPHKDGESANVGSPLGKTFLKYFESGTLTSPGNDAKEALDMSAQCSYWISARDRVMGQMVVWGGQGGIDLGLPHTDTGGEKKWGMILPQVMTMGTVTRRAIEKTWLTASNAKPNRIGSELKAMVRAPPGFAIVGADVDSEELWISSVMGDAQFGLHGATALGWMTLEGTKSTGTDLHSKTASILGITRDQAKVFNYSRIYGAGMKHAMLLLLQSNPNMSVEEAQRLAHNLYASTKGRNTHRKDFFGRKFWYSGTESFVFNKLEEIAMSDCPKTPALGCGVTNALSKEYLPENFGQDYMPSRINWVVQSSGVDYLHLLIVSMEHLISKYDIKARYLISVHDELRYLVEDQDRYRCALALQIANLWTRCQFAYRLGMDDLPQGVAFFSAVDIDHVLRKEVDMTCVTPSHPHPIQPGESLDINDIIKKTGGGTMQRDGSPMPLEEPVGYGDSLEGYVKPNCLEHRATGADFLRAQATSELSEIQMLAKATSDRHIHQISSISKSTRNRRSSLSRARKDPAMPRLTPTSSHKEGFENTWDAVVELEQSSYAKDRRS